MPPDVITHPAGQRPSDTPVAPAFRDFVDTLTTLVAAATTGVADVAGAAEANRTTAEEAAAAAEALLLQRGATALRKLIADDAWLPDAYAKPSAERYQQYLLYVDPHGRFSVVSFVWGPGQSTPVHDHTVWGLIGMLRGAERAVGFTRTDDGDLQASHAPQVLHPGDVEAVSPRIGDIHQVANVYDDRVSVSIHVYGADIGTVSRWVYPAEGAPKAFISGYSNGTLPPLLAAA